MVCGVIRRWADDWIAASALRVKIYRHGMNMHWAGWELCYHAEMTCRTLTSCLKISSYFFSGLERWQWSTLKGGLALRAVCQPTPQAHYSCPFGRFGVRHMSVCPAKGKPLDGWSVWWWTLICRLGVLFLPSPLSCGEGYESLSKGLWSPFYVFRTYAFFLRGRSNRF